MKYFLLTFCLTSTLFFFGCTIKQIPKAEKDAKEAARKWLELVDNGKYSECWENCTQKIGNKKGWINYFNRYRKPLGKLVSRKLVIKKFSKKPKNAFFLIYKTSFEKNKYGSEQLNVTLGENGKWKVSYYKIK